MTPSDKEEPLIPARILNEYVYCPRLAYLEWVQGEFLENADVAEGRLLHRPISRESGHFPAPEESDPGKPIVARQVTLSSERLGIVSRIDLLESQNGQVVPVDYKKGCAPDLPQGTWEEDRIQVCAQVLLLRDNGYPCTEGIIYYCGSRRRVRVPVDASLEANCISITDEIRRMASRGVPPPPLSQSPKCLRCSLAPLCLPDEVTALQSGSPEEIRRIFPAREDAAPLYVQEQGLTIGLRNERVEIRSKGTLIRDLRLLDVSQVSIFGNVQITTQAIKAFMDYGIPVCYFTTGGWFQGWTQGMIHKNIELRRKQFSSAEDPQRCLSLARKFVYGKIRNARTLIRRNHPGNPGNSLAELANLAENAQKSDSMEKLLGIEGTAARIYFSQFGDLLRGGEPEYRIFDFNRRSRRPPEDPVNALLSFLYALLAKDVTVTLTAVGFDPFLGFYHQPRYGRPALALDLMEEFRPLIVDSTVLLMVNRKEIGPSDFLHRGRMWSLTEIGRKTVIRAYERRMEELVTHPIFGYSVSYRRVIEIQARLLGRALAGEIPEYISFETR